MALGPAGATMRVLTQSCADGLSGRQRVAETARLGAVAAPRRWHVSKAARCVGQRCPCRGASHCGTVAAAREGADRNSCCSDGHPLGLLLRLS